MKAGSNIAALQDVVDTFDVDDSSTDDAPTVSNATPAQMPLVVRVDQPERVEAPSFRIGEAPEIGAGEKDQHDSDMADERVDVGVKRIGAILRLMAGEYGASRLLDIGRRAARQIEMLGSVGNLHSEIDDPVMRYAVLELIKGSFLHDGATEAKKLVDSELDTLYRSEGRRIRASINTAEAAFSFSAEPKSQAEFRRLYYEAIDLNAPLTAKLLFNGITSVVNVDDIDRVIASMSEALRDDMLTARSSVPRDHLARMLSYLELFGSARVAQTMVSFAREILTALGAKAIVPTTQGRSSSDEATAGDGGKEKAREKELSLTKELFNLGTSTLPGPLIDKLADTLVGKDAQRRSWLVTLLYRLSCKFPMPVWASEEIRNAAHTQMHRRMDQFFNLRQHVLRRSRPLVISS
ncbi:HrpJ domain-containing protein [Trinickia fusca]|nr:HrpJ domain-containing protein [Trinickia fusca]